MTIPTDNSPRPLPKLIGTIPIVDRDGRATDNFLQIMQRFRDYNNAGNRVIPCNASGTNVITLTPLDASPVLERYNDYEIFVFTAAETSTDSVTATVVPKTGTLATLNVYKTDGASQAGSGDVVQNSVYMLIVADHLDGGSGGFVLK